MNNGLMCHSVMGAIRDTFAALQLRRHVADHTCPACLGKDDIRRHHAHLHRS